MIFDTPNTSTRLDTTGRCLEIPFVENAQRLIVRAHSELILIVWGVRDGSYAAIESNKSIREDDAAILTETYFLLDDTGAFNPNLRSQALKTQSSAPV